MSAYQGWLLKIGDYVIDQSRFIAAESYQPAVNMQDVDPWTDANGYVHRNAVELKALSVDFSTPAMLTDDDLQELLSGIRRNFIDATEQGCNITAYIPFLGQYVTQYGYMADIKPTIYDGFVNNPRKIIRMCGASEDDLKSLIDNRFLLSFDSGVMLVKHWRIHNYIPPDRYKPSCYMDEKSKIGVKLNGSYTTDPKKMVSPVEGNPKKSCYDKEIKLDKR